ncbi:MAG: MobC family plasmid mobilization relaxosome protein [Prevotellaceae bacterium]|jgi:hypothetical protein|nr:MobC family plasmid mobilization relaxosome protein [Prevotellaceae bacterium]
MKNTVSVWVELKPEDKEKLKANARIARMSMSQYVMHLVENRPIVVVNSLPKFIAELNKIGTNINQIAHQANTQKFITIDRINQLNEHTKIVDIIGKNVCKSIENLRLPTTSQNAKSDTNITAEIVKKLDLILKLLQEQEGEKWQL